MIDYKSGPGWELFVGDCRESMMMCVPDASVQMCVTSPPYFGLRDYGCDGQLGLEETPEAYIAAMVGVFREVRRVLKDDGVMWLNIGDSYASTGGNHAGRTDQKGVGAARVLANDAGDRGNRTAPAGLKPKDLIGVPWMLAFALRADGWYLRQDIIWHKPNPMPESVKDRCTKAHEYVFLLSKSEKYYFDSDAMREPAVGGSRGAAASFKRTGSKRGKAGICPNSPMATHREDREDVRYDGEFRNRRSVWTVATKPYKGAHFATYPAELIEPCVLAGSRVGDKVIDPFGGSGTTAQVSLRHGRHAILCELNSDYTPLITDRIEGVTACA